MDNRDLMTVEYYAAQDPDRLIGAAYVPRKDARAARASSDGPCARRWGWTRWKRGCWIIAAS